MEKEAKNKQQTLQKNTGQSSKAVVKQQPSLLEALLKNTPNKDLIKQFGTLTMHKVLQSDTLCIASLKRAYKEEAVETALIILLYETVKYFDNKIDESIISEIAAEIMSTYPSLSFEDVFVLLKEIKESGVYNLTPSIILNKLKKYWESRMDMAEKLSYSKHLQQKDVGDRTNNMRELMKEAGKLAEKYHAGKLFERTEL